MTVQVVASSVKRCLILTLVISVPLLSCSFENAEQKKIRSEEAAKLRQQQDAKARLAKAKAAVTEDFFDPESARFRTLREKLVRVAQDSQTRVRILCGEVNSKNRFGAYVGYRPFLTIMTVSTPAKEHKADHWWPGDTLIRSVELEGDRGSTTEIVLDMLEKLTFETTCGDGPTIPPLELLASTPGLSLVERPEVAMRELEMRPGSAPTSLPKQRSLLSSTGPRRHVEVSDLLGTWGSPDHLCDGGEVTFARGGIYSTQEGDGRWSLKNGLLSLTNWNPGSAQVSLMPNGNLQVVWSDKQSEEWSRVANCPPPQTLDQASDDPLG